MSAVILTVCNTIMNPVEAHEYCKATRCPNFMCALVLVNLQLNFLAWQFPNDYWNQQFFQPLDEGFCCT